MLNSSTSQLSSDNVSIDFDTLHPQDELTEFYNPNATGFTPRPLSEPLSKFNIESIVGKSYIDVSNNHISSNALDVLALYIKGQKLLYTEAKTYCEQQLNFLMLPAIFISCVGSIFSFLSDRYTFGPVIIASLNGFNAFI
jgi:hypothetical protein